MGSLKAFDRPQSSIDFAEAAIQEMIAELEAFFATDPLQVVREVDPEFGEVVLKYVLIRDLPPVLERKATEALNNLKNAFDQMLFAICEAIGQPIKEGHYPWADTPHGLAERRRRNANAERKRVIPPEVWDEIERQAPYKRGHDYAGGDDLVREMAALANDKHTVGLVTTARFRRASHRIRINSVIGSFHTPLPVWDPVKNEAVFQRSTGKVDAYCEYTATLYVVFDVPVSALDAATALGAFLAKAKGSLEGFKDLAVRMGAT